MSPLANRKFPFLIPVACLLASGLIVLSVRHFVVHAQNLTGLQPMAAASLCMQINSTAWALVVHQTSLTGPVIAVAPCLEKTMCTRLQQHIGANAECFQ